MGTEVFGRQADRQTYKDMTKLMHSLFTIL